MDIKKVLKYLGLVLLIILIFLVIAYIVGSNTTDINTTTEQDNTEPEMISEQEMIKELNTYCAEGVTVVEITQVDRENYFITCKLSTGEEATLDLQGMTKDKREFWSKAISIDLN